MNIGGCAGWPVLKKLIKESLDIQTDILNLYSRDGMKKVYEKEWSGLQDEAEYFVETEDDLLQKFTTMESFYERLRTERKRPHSEIDIVKAVFRDQGILFDELIVTGDLALTDEKLQKYGISQGGLRTAILSVIRSNQ